MIDYEKIAEAHRLIHENYLLKDYTFNIDFKQDITIRLSRGGILCILITSDPDLLVRRLMEVVND